MRILGGPCNVGSEPGPHKTGKVGMCVCVCVCVCVCAFTPAYLLGHGYGNTPELWGLFSQWRQFSVPRKISS